MIASAKYKAEPAVRRSRILKLESELRIIEARYTPKPDAPRMLQEPYDWSTQTYGAECEHVYCSAGGRGGEWVPVHRLEPRKLRYARLVAHLKMRIEYETAMIGDEGGRASDADIEPGGWVAIPKSSREMFDNKDGWAQVQKVTKSPKTKRVTSVGLLGYGYSYHWASPTHKMQSFSVERLGEDAYRAPTDEEREQFAETSKAKKAEAKASTPKTIPLVNLTREDCQRVQDLLNVAAKAVYDSKPRYTDEWKPSEVLELTQEQYSANSKGEYALCETRTFYDSGKISRRFSNCYSAEGSKYDKSLGAPVCKLRIRANGGYNYYTADRVIFLTDKPTKELPAFDVAELSQAESVEVSHE